MADTTTRYPSSATCSYAHHKIQAGDIYQFGCELEFYIDTDRHKFTEDVLRFDKEPAWKAELIAQHEKLVASTPKEAQSEFSKAIAQTNLLSTGKE